MDQPNNVKRLREEKMLSKAELARLASISPLTLDRIEKGKACRMATKRKILLALGLKTNQRERVFKNNSHV
jgi:DNA-binding XRE family transcriptional regulator